MLLTPYAPTCFPKSRLHLFSLVFHNHFSSYVSSGYIKPDAISRVLQFTSITFQYGLPQIYLNTVTIIFCTGPASLPGKFHYTDMPSATLIISIDVYSTTVHIQLLPSTAPSTRKYLSSEALQYSPKYTSRHHNSPPVVSKCIDQHSSADAKSTLA